MTYDDPEEDALVRRVRARTQLDAQQLDDDTTRALRMARQRALESHGRGGRRLWPALAVAASLAAVATIGVRLIADRAPAQVDLLAAQDVMNDLDLLTEDEDLSLLEDLEFYAWLSVDDEDVS